MPAAQCQPSASWRERSRGHAIGAMPSATTTGPKASLSKVLAAGLPSWVASFNLVVFEISLFSALVDPQWREPGLALQAVEIFAGVAAVTTAATRAGHVAEAIDVVIGGKRHDLLTRGGFLTALACVLALPPGGLAVLAPVCSSFVFPNSSRTGRKRGNFAGDARYLPVKRGNAMAAVSMFLFAVALARDCMAVFENPAGSTIFSYLEQWISIIPKANLEYFVAHRCAYSSEPHGQRLFKPYKFMVCGPAMFGSGRWLAPAVRRCSCPGGKHLALMAEDEHGNVSGTPALQESQSYPSQLGSRIVQAWEAARVRAGESSDDEPGSSLTSSSSEAMAEDTYSDDSDSSSQESEERPTRRTLAGSGRSSHQFLPKSWGDEPETPAEPACVFQPVAWGDA